MGRDHTMRIHDVNKTMLKQETDHARFLHRH